LLYYAAAVRSAFEPYLTGRTMPNYINSAGEPQRTYDDEVRARVQRVRQDVDPSGLFAGDVGYR
ncbi:MAG: FAD-binding protein, partial [Actinoplanes sp.]